MLSNKNIFKLCISILLYVFGLNLNAQNPFIENKKQFPQQVKAKINLPSGALFIEEGKLVYAFYSGEQLASIHDLRASKKQIDAHSYVVEFIKSNADISTELSQESKYHENYFLGDQSKWATNVRSYKSLHQYNIYNGIDFRYYIDQGKLKYDIVIQPNANPKQIQMRYTGVENIKLYNNNVFINTSVNTVKESSPYAYQIINGNQVEVRCAYLLKKDILFFEFPEGYNQK